MTTSGRSAADAASGYSAEPEPSCTVSAAIAVSIPNADDYDNMHHAFGRPHSPNRDCYRNYFATDVGGKLAQRFEALGWWDLGRADGRLAFYSVNGAGKQALADWMATHIYTGGRWLEAETPNPCGDSRHD